MKKLCTICVRSGSKGVPGKNVKLMNSKPLLQYTVEQAIGSGIFDEIVVSTDSQKIIKLVKSLGLNPWFIRPNNLSKDTTPKIPVIRHALVEAEKYFNCNFDIIFDLDVTSPLRKISDIHNAFSKFNNDNSDILITASHARKNPYFNMVELRDNKVRLVKDRSKLIGSRQEAPIVFDMNASIYIWKRNILMSSNNLFRDNTSLYVMPEERSFDIDSKMDWNIVEAIMRKGAQD